MVGREDDNCVFSHSALFQHFQQPTHIVVDVAHSSEIGSTCTKDGFVGRFLFLQTFHMQQALAVGILVLIRDCHVGKRDLFVLIAIPIFLVDGVRIMGVGEGDGEAERAIGGFASGGGVEVASRLEHDLFVEVKLVGADAGASLKDRGGIVVPFEASIGFIPIHGPKSDERRP